MSEIESTIDVTYLQDTRLTWRAKGLLTWLHTQPFGAMPIDARRYSSSDVELAKAAEELVKCGYLSPVTPNPFNALLPLAQA